MCKRIHGPVITRFKVHFDELLICDVALVRSQVREDFSVSVWDRFQPSIVRILGIVLMGWSLLPNELRPF